MSFETLIVLAVVYAILNAVGKAQEQAKLRRRQAELDREHADRPQRADDIPQGSPGGSTQAEALKLEEWLRGLGLEVPTSEPPVGAAPPPPAPTPVPEPVPAPAPRRLPAAQRKRRKAGPLGRPADRPLEGAEEVEEAVSLEVEPRVESLERLDVERAPRLRVDRDDQAGMVAQQRRSEAASRDRALTRADHAAFDARIRTPAPAVPGGRTPAERRALLRRAFVAAEVLGAPVGLRPPA